ncbi:MAG: hypothetical protein GEU83_18040 [Pseudonocardiaceae bacterium]|nr:hypothetical protein [Pseudonocardiaceae bacterium]
MVGNVGIGMHELGIHERAEAHLTTAAALTIGAPFLHSLYLARQTKTAMRARQPEMAAEQMTALASVVPLVDSPRLRIHERHIFDGTQRWAGVPDVRDARQALQEVRV